MVEIGQVWVHDRSGVEYTVLDITNKHAEEHKREKFPLMVTYSAADDHRRWTLPVWSFVESRTLKG